MIGIFVNPVILCVLLYLVARHNAEYDFGTVFFVSLGVTISGFFAVALVGPILGGIVQLALAGYLLVRFCYVTLKQTIIVLIAFVACQLVLAYALARTLR